MQQVLTADGITVRACACPVVEHAHVVGKNKLCCLARRSSYLPCVLLLLPTIITCRPVNNCACFAFCMHVRQRYSPVWTTVQHRSRGRGRGCCGLRVQGWAQRTALWAMQTGYRAERVARVVITCRARALICPPQQSVMCLLCLRLAPGGTCLLARLGADRCSPQQDCAEGYLHPAPISTYHPSSVA